MFHVVETEICSNAQFVVCYDMGNEWADHIANLRRGNGVNAFIDAFKALRVNPNRNKEVCIVIYFLSKAELVDAFIHIKQGSDFRQRNTVIQMVWILNAFISCCKEAGLKSKIYCRE